VKNADETREEYKALQKASAINHHSGFSSRLHCLIDQVEGLGIPKREERGRLSSIAKLTGHSKPSVSEWFKKDKLPSDDIFTALVRFFLQYIESDESSIKIESWLRYGEEATPDPFSGIAKNDKQETLNKVALELLTIVVKEDKVSVSDTDLDCVLADTINMIEDYGVINQVGAPLLIYGLIRIYIKDHAKKQ